MSFKKLGELTIDETPVANSNNLITSGAVANLSNPNLLINGDFRVNQRGKSVYSMLDEVAYSRVYTVDKWRFVPQSSTSNSSVTVNSKSVSIYCEKQYDNFSQIIENYANFEGKTVTVSAKIGAMSSNNFALNISVDGSQVGYVNILSADRIWSFTTTLPNSITSSLRVSIVNAVNSSATIELEWVKMEIGNISTPFVPRPYEEELAMCQMPYNDGGEKYGLSTIYGNPNLLINGDFRINQRGQASYSTSGGYTVDRWRLVSNNIIATPLSNGGINVQITGQWAYLSYTMEEKDWKALLGKTITLSMKVSRLSQNYRPYFQISTKSGGTATNTRIVKTGITSFVYTVPSDADKLEIRIAYTTSSEGSISVDMDIDYVKVELGSVVTPFNPRPYTEELAMCQRYYQVFTTQGIRPYLYTSAPLVAFILPIPVTLRTTGTLTIGTGSGIQPLTGGSIDTNWTFSQLTPKSDNCIKIKAIPNGSQVPADCNVNLQGTTELDAEIY